MESREALNSPEKSQGVPSKTTSPTRSTVRNASYSPNAARKSHERNFQFSAIFTWGLPALNGIRFINKLESFTDCIADGLSTRAVVNSSAIHSIQAQSLPGGEPR